MHVGPEALWLKKFDPTGRRTNREPILPFRCLDTENHCQHKLYHIYVPPPVLPTWSWSWSETIPMKMISRAGQCPSSTISLSLACQRLSHGKKEETVLLLLLLLQYTVCTTTIYCGLSEIGLHNIICTKTKTNINNDVIINIKWHQDQDHCRETGSFSWKKAFCGQFLKWLEKILS